MAAPEHKPGKVGCWARRAVTSQPTLPINQGDTMDEFKRIHGQLLHLIKEEPKATGMTTRQMLAMGAMLLFFNLIAILAIWKG